MNRAHGRVAVVHPQVERPLYTMALQTQQPVGNAAAVQTDTVRPAAALPIEPVVLQYFGTERCTSHDFAPFAPWRRHYTYDANTENGGSNT